MVDALVGEGQLRIAKGEIKHMNLTDMLHNVAGAFTGNGDSQSSTYFTELSASYNIAQGIITNRDLNMQVKDFNVSGEGNVSLPAYTINYHLVPKILRTTQDANGVTTVKQGLAVPLLIEASLDNPQFKPDLAAAAQQALQDPKQLKEQLRNSREVLKEQIKAPKEAVKNLKGLLKGFGGR
jgi:AsmA protein